MSYKIAFFRIIVTILMLSSPDCSSDQLVENHVEIKELLELDSDSLENFFKIGQYHEGLFSAGRSNSNNAAIFWYEKIKDKDGGLSYNALGLLYIAGNGVEQDAKIAVDYFRKGAVLGNREAQYNLGLRYDQGSGIEPNKVKAYEWYLKAAKQGLNVAQKALGDMHFLGVGTEKSRKDAIKWYLRAAQENNLASMYNLGAFYLEDNSTKNEGLKWLEIAAKKGHAKSNFLLGIYFRQKGINDRAFKYMFNAASLGHGDAFNNLGIYYYQGIGTEVSIPKSRNSFNIALGLGVTEAKDNLEIFPQNK